MKKISIALTLLLACSFYSCKKYDEGPLISLRSVQKRLLGKWEVKQFLKDDIDLTNFYTDSCGCTLTFVYDDVSMQGVPVQAFIIDCIVNDWNTNTDELGLNRNEYCMSNWSFSTDKKSLLLKMGYNNDHRYRWGMYPLTVSPYYVSSFEIIRLTNKELWLRFDDINNIYNFKFEKDEDK